MAKLLFGAVFLLLAASQVFGTEYKTEFAQKYEEGIQRIVKETYLSIFKANIEFCEHVINVTKEINNNTADTSKIRKYIDKITAFKDKLEGPKLSSEDFVQQVLRMREALNMDTLLNSLEESVSNTVKKNVYEKQKEEMAQKFADLWSELYVNVSSDELSKYPAYKDINGVFEIMYNPPREKLTGMNMAFTRIILFFDLAAYKKLYFMFSEAEGSLDYFGFF